MHVDKKVLAWSTKKCFGSWPVRFRHTSLQCSRCIYITGVLKLLQSRFARPVICTFIWYTMSWQMANELWVAIVTLHFHSQHSADCLSIWWVSVLEVEKSWQALRGKFCPGVMQLFHWGQLIWVCKELHKKVWVIITDCVWQELHHLIWIYEIKKRQRTLRCKLS